MHFERAAGLLLAMVLTVSGTAQDVYRTEPANSGSPAGMARPVVDVNSLLARIEQTASAASMEIAQLRIEKWKGDKSFKQQSQENADLLLRNLTAALPAIVSAVRRAPNDFAASFKLYRNLGALYDVMASLAESAGAYGPKDDFEALAKQAESLDAARRAFGDRLEELAAQKDAEIARLRSQLRLPPSGAAAPKRIVVDDTASKKPASKKPTPAKKPAPAPTQTSPR
jgi:hypothetical protein